MARLRRLTGRRPKPASDTNPRSQAHPMPAGPSTMPAVDAPRPESAPPEAMPVMATPDPSGETSPAAPAVDERPVGPAEAAATPTHTWTAEDQPYDRIDCPACGTIFRDVPDRVGTCPACGATIHVLICREGVRHLLTAADLDAFDDDWDALHVRRKREEAQQRNLVALRARRATLDSYIELGVRLVELRTAPGACPVCVTAAGHPYRPRAAPALPIAGCGHDMCRCLYAPARPSTTHR